MEFSSSEKPTILTSLDDFADYALAYPHLFKDLTDVSEAFTNGTDLILPSMVPDLYEILIPAMPAVLDAAGIQIHAARPALPKYTFIANNELSADSRRELAINQRDKEKQIEKYKDQKAKAMKRVLSTIDKSVITNLTNYDKVRFTNCVDNNLVFSFKQLMEDASNQGSSANGTAALNTLLIPDIPESTTPDNIVRKFNDNGDKVDSLLSDPLNPGSITINQLKVTICILHVTKTFCIGSMLPIQQEKQMIFLEYRPNGYKARRH